jgi:hypothetical protein
LASPLAENFLMLYPNCGKCGRRFQISYAMAAWRVMRYSAYLVLSILTSSTPTSPSIRCPECSGKGR